MAERFDAIDRIARILTSLQAEVKAANRLGLTDINFHAEFFYRDLLNIIYDFNLENIDFLPGVDLIDKEMMLAIQVTSQNNAARISRGVENFFRYPENLRYKLRILLIAENAKNYKTDFTQGGRYDFNPHEDIIDIPRLIDSISDLPLGKTERILEFLEKEATEKTKDGGETIRMPNHTVRRQTGKAPLAGVVSQRSDASADSPVAPEGMSTHVASDLWTTEDALGYADYAYAIYKFISHPRTKPPLTISIQAPWGGGKTSLMRMIRKYIDPEADKQAEEAAKQPKGVLTLQGAKDEIAKWIEKKTNREPIEDADRVKLEKQNPEAQNLSVWFNAWKYENTNQVWAGLIDAILQQVASRLPVRERELFWLRLNLQRINADKIRQKMHEHIFNYFWRGLDWWLKRLVPVFALAFTLILIGLFGNSFWTLFGSASLLSLVGTAVTAYLKLQKASTDAKEEPAVVSLNEYLEIPKYAEETGFIHHAEADLQRVLECITERYKPLVVFIDDLDRCSPTKISQVVEAVNLFLAGDFPNCIFIIGMDTEMVAAALQSAHKDMISNLPSDLGVPIGWRFMDKFVQLPFMIPPSRGFTQQYIDSLFAEEEETPIPEKEQQRILSIVNESIPSLPSQSEEALEELIKVQKITSTEEAGFRKLAELRIRQITIDKGVQEFSDKNSEIHDLLNNVKAYDHFTDNPRDLKRFVNACRFNYFLWWAKKSDGVEVSSVEQLMRWTILSMKWPEVVRWLRRDGGSEWEDTSTKTNKQTTTEELVERLKVFEETTILSKTFSQWRTTIAERFSLDAQSTLWLYDEDIYHFFKKEGKLTEKERISGGIGKGLW